MRYPNLLFPWGHPESHTSPLTVVITRNYKHLQTVIQQLKIPGAMYQLLSANAAGVRIETLLIVEDALEVPNGLDIFNNHWRTRLIPNGNIFHVRSY